MFISNKYKKSNTSIQIGNYDQCNLVKYRKCIYKIKLICKAKYVMFTEKLVSLKKKLMKSFRGKRRQLNCKG